MACAQLAALLEADCTEAMRWCLEMDRRHYKAAWQLARAAAQRGRHAEAAEQLAGLFSTPRRPFQLNMTLLEEKLPRRVCFAFAEVAYPRQEPPHPFIF
jgi:hypothetical protein